MAERIASERKKMPAGLPTRSEDVGRIAGRGKRYRQESLLLLEIKKREVKKNGMA